MNENRRLGYFNVDLLIIHNNEDQAKKLTKDMIILEARRVDWDRSIEYLAVSDHFDEVPRGGKVPKYACHHNEGDWVFVREGK